MFKSSFGGSVVVRFYDAMCSKDSEFRHKIAEGL